MTQAGVFVGNDPSALAAYEKWVGKAPDNVLNYMNNSSWAAFDSSVPWEVGLWQDTKTPSIWSVPLTVNGTALEQVATGAFNDHFLKAAKALAETKPSSDGSIYIRVGWEFNGDWMPWASKGHEAAFIKSFQQLVTTFRSVSDDFKFVWDVNESDSDYNPELAYPGDKYVDVVGMDTYYNTGWDSKDPVAAFKHNVEVKYGLQWQQDFAAKHGKPTALSEWGVMSENAGPYIEAITQWMADHDMVFANYWDSNSDFKGKLSNGQYPALEKIYKEAIAELASGSGGGSGSGSDHTAPTISIAKIAVDDALNQSEVTKALTVTGTTDGAEDGQVVTVTLNNRSYTGTVKDDAWKVVVPTADVAAMGKANGTTYKVTAKVSDDAGNVSNDAARNLVIDKTADAGKAATLKVNATSDGVLDAQEAKAVAFTVANLDADSKAVATFTDGVHTKTTAIKADGTASVDLSAFDGTVKSSLSIVDGHGNRASVAGNSFKVDTGTDTNTGSGTDKLVFKVSGESYQGDAQFVVKVDGQQVGGVHTVNSAHSGGEWENVTLTGDFDNAKTVAVQFINDLYKAGSGDRNLYVAEVQVNGHALDASEGSLNGHARYDYDPSVAKLLSYSNVSWDVAL